MGHDTDRRPVGVGQALDLLHEFAVVNDEPLAVHDGGEAVFGVGTFDHQKIPRQSQGLQNAFDHALGVAVGRESQIIANVLRRIQPTVAHVVADERFGFFFGCLGGRESA